MRAVSLPVREINCVAGRRRTESRQRTSRPATMGARCLGAFRETFRAVAAHPGVKRSLAGFKRLNQRIESDE